MVTLVTGSTGLVGNNVVRLLLAQGHAVRVLCRRGADERPLAGLDLEAVEGDVRDLDLLHRACQGVSRIIHAAAQVRIGWTGLDLLTAVNVDGTRNVIDAARQSGARMVHVSSVDTMACGSRARPADEDTPDNGHVLCPYVVTKRAAERLVLEAAAEGLDAVVVNPGFMLGPWDWKPSSGRMLLAVAQGKMRIAPPGGNDFCDVRDVAAGVLAAAERGVAGRRYILGGEPLSYFEAWTLFAKITGARPPWRVGRKPVLRTLGRLGDLWGRLTGREPDLNSAAVAISFLEHHFSCARAQKELGYTYRPARQAAEAAWAWFQEWGFSAPSRPGRARLGKQPAQAGRNALA